MIARFRGVALLIGISVALFLISLTQTAYRVDRTQDADSGGMMALLLGWVVIFDGMIAWCANPLILIAWIFMFWRRLRFISIIASALALIVALSFLRHADILVDEGVGRAKIVSRGPGYWLWVASMGAQLISSTAAVIVNAFSR